MLPNCAWSDGPEHTGAREVITEEMCALILGLQWNHLWNEPQLFFLIFLLFFFFVLDKSSIWFSLTVPPGGLRFLCSLALNHSILHLYGTQRNPKHAEIISQIFLLEAWAQLIPKLMGGEHKHLKGRICPFRQRGIVLPTAEVQLPVRQNMANG